MSFLYIPVSRGSNGNNTFVGVSALRSITTGSNNSAFGLDSLLDLTTGSGNSAFGQQSLSDLISGSSNCAFGNQALLSLDSGSFNVAFGQGALRNINSGSSNVAIGTNALFNLSVSLGNNTAVGNGAGSQITTGGENTILGCFNGNQGGLDIRTLDNYIVLSDGDGNPRLWIDNTGAVNIPGGISPSGAGNILTLQDIGTDPNEIPLNQYLGTMAFQDAAAVNLGIAEIDEIRIDKTITPGGTTGAQTIDKNAGSVNFAAAATSVVVTNSLITTSSVIVATIATNDATMTSVQVVAAAGSFTIYANVAPTAETRVNFLVIN